MTKQYKYEQREEFHRPGARRESAPTDGTAERDDGRTSTDSGFAFDRSRRRTVRDDDDGFDDDDARDDDSHTRARCARRWTRERRKGDDVDETWSDDGRRRR